VSESAGKKHQAIRENQKQPKYPGKTAIKWNNMGMSGWAYMQCDSAVIISNEAVGANQKSSK